MKKEKMESNMEFGAEMCKLMREINENTELKGRWKEIIKELREKEIKNGRNKDESIL